MAKGNILKEAIADAKTVREVALQNAKSALEEAFTPKLQNMLSAKLQEDLDEDMYMDEDDDRDLELGEMGNMYDEDMDEDMYEGEKENSMDEEIDLEEILNELELEENKEADDEEVVSEKKEDDEKEDIEEIHSINPQAEDVSKVYYGTKVHEDKEFNLDSLLQEINNLDKQPVRGSSRKGMKATTQAAILKRRKMNENKGRNIPNNSRTSRGCKEQVSQLSQAKKELREAKKAFTTVKNELNEVNLLNSKLLYVNRIFKANTLDDAQKLRVVETLDKADSTKEAKLIYETIKDTFKVANTKKVSNKRQTKKTIKESFRGMASKSAGTSRTKKTAPKRAIISESNNMVNRFQKLANIKISE